MRKFLIAAFSGLSILGLAACSDSGVDEGATGSVEAPVTTPETAPAEPADPAADPAAPAAPAE